MTKKYQARSDGKCSICETSKAVTCDKLFCRRCFRKLLDEEYRPVRTYVGSERLDRKQFEHDRFDRAEIVDTDAEYGLGGRPDYDAWFAPPEEIDD